MSTESQLTPQLCLFAASILLGLATYMSLAPLFHAVLSPKSVQREVWSLHALRWLHLRRTSPIFRIFDRWIIGLASILRSYLPWFLQTPHVGTGYPIAASRNIKQDLRGMLASFFQLVNGNPERTLQAVRTRTCEQPWAHAELVATSIYMAIVAAALTFVCFFNRWSWAMLVVSSCLMGWLVYRGSLLHFVRKADSRRDEIRRFLPHAIDLVAMVLFAGDSLVMALEEVIADFPYHPLSQEFELLRSALGGGLVPQEALNDMASRVALPEVTEFVAALNQKEEHGTPVANRVMELANQLRIRRLRQLEDEAGRAETHLSGPTALIMLACLLCVAAPFALSIYKLNIFNMF